MLAATLAAVALPAAASADPYWRGGDGWHNGWHDGGWDRDRDWRRAEWRAHEWREWRAHEWREHHPYDGYGGYARPYVEARPPVVYVDPYPY